MRATLLLARRELGRHPLRTALTTAGVACGVALVVAIQAINTTTLAAFTDAIDDLAGTAALQVRGQGPFDEAIADAIRAKDPDLAAARSREHLAAVRSSVN